MRVAIDGLPLGSGQGGDETMLTGFLTGLSVAAGPDDEFPIFMSSGGAVPDSVADDPRFPVVRTFRRLHGIAHYSSRFPAELAAYARKQPLDLVFSANKGPIWAPCPKVLMVQDLSFVHYPNHYPPTNYRLLMEIVPRLARRARVVLTVSEHARNDLIEGLGLPEDRVFVAPNMIAPPPPFGADDEARGATWLKEHGITGPFLLYLGNLHRRKNVVRTVRAFIEAKANHPELAEHQMAIAGAAWWGSEAEHEATADAPPGSVVYLGRVDDWQREVVLHLASALSYVSIFEGFGLPPLEAMARGTAVLTSNATSLPEVVGDAALQVDPFDEHAIAEGITRILTDDRLREELVARGGPRAATVTAARTGQAAMTAFRTALAPT